MHSLVLRYISCCQLVAICKDSFWHHSATQAWLYSMWSCMLSPRHGNWIFLNTPHPFWPQLYPRYLLITTPKCSRPGSFSSLDQENFSPPAIFISASELFFHHRILFAFLLDWAKSVLSILYFLHQDQEEFNFIGLFHFVSIIYL